VIAATTAEQFRSHTLFLLSLTDELFDCFAAMSAT
jgi:hypothetical protein